MNLEKLEVGMVVKNYRSLCELLGVNTKTGNSKKSQLKDWERYFSYDKDGIKFVITEIHNNVKDKNNNHGGSRYSVYGDVVQLLILNLLGRENGRMTIGRTKLQNTIGMVNFNFSVGKSKMEDLARILKTNIYTVRDFYNTNDDNFKKIIEYSLEQLSDKRIISYENTMKGRDSVTGSIRDLTDDEKELVLLVEGRILIQFGYEKISDIRNSEDWKTYKDKCNTLIKDLTSLSYYFEAYKIFVNNDLAENERLKLINSIILSDEEFSENKKVLNSIILERNNTNAIKRREKEIMKSTITKFHRTKEEYIEDIKKLSSLLLNIGCNNDLRVLISNNNKKSKQETIEDLVASNVPF